MTRIETALARMLHEWDSGGWVRSIDDKDDHLTMKAREMVAKPTGQALSALVEAAEAWYMGGDDSSDSRLTDAVIAFRALADRPERRADSAESLDAALGGDRA